MKVVGAFFVVLGLVVFSGIAFSYFNDSVLFSPDEKMSRIILTNNNPRVYIVYKDVGYRIDLVTVSDISATFNVRNLETGNVDQKKINEGQIKRIGDLRFKLINTDENEIYFGAEFLVTGNIIEDNCVEPPRGLVSWWPGDGNARDIKDGNEGIYHGGTMGHGSGKVVTAFDFKQTGLGDDYIEVPYSDNLGVTSVTIDAWVKPKDISARKNQFFVDRGAYGIEMIDGRVECFFWLENGLNTLGSNLNYLPEDEWTYVSCTYNEETGVGVLYKNGENIGDFDAQDNNPLIYTENSLWFGGAQGWNFFVGLIDEVEIHNVALTEEEIKAIYDAGSFGKCKEETPMHTACEENSCVVVEGEGSNECLTNEDCTHLECVANACQIVSGQGEDQCGPGKPPCGGEEWHYACVGNRGCVLTPGPGPDTCGPEELCPAIGNPGGTD